MKSIIAAFILFCVMLGNSAIATEGLTLRGKGVISYLGFIDVYEAALYTEKRDDIVNILDPELSKCLRLDYKVSLSPEDFIKSADTVLKRQHQSQTLDRVAREISALHKAYLPVKQGDHYQLCYDGEKKLTTLLLNRQELVTIESAEFGSIYLGIWLGAREPIDERLRDSLLYGRN